jgi:hypothetical protein
MIAAPAPTRYPALEARDRETAACVRELSDPELYNFHESVLWRTHSLTELDPESAAFAAVNVEADLAIVTAEIRRRDRARQTGWTNPYQARSDALMALTDAIRQDVDLCDLLEHEGVSVARGRLEAHSPCPLCLGTDRFIIWHPPESHGWCRQCDIGGDVIFWARSFWQVGFADAVMRLADEFLGLREAVSA